MPSRISEACNFFIPNEPEIIMPDIKIQLPGDRPVNRGVIIPKPPNGPPRIPPGFRRKPGRKGDEIGDYEPDTRPKQKEKASINRLRSTIEPNTVLTNPIEMAQGSTRFPINDLVELEKFWPNPLPTNGLTTFQLWSTNVSGTAVKYDIREFHVIPLDQIYATDYLMQIVRTHFSSYPEYHFVENIVPCVVTFYADVTEETINAMNDTNRYVYAVTD